MDTLPTRSRSPCFERPRRTRNLCYPTYRSYDYWRSHHHPSQRRTLGGHAFTLVGYVIWWIGVVWVFVACVVVLTVLFYTGNQADRDMTPVLFMAPVGMATAASEAGLITIYGFDMSSRLAVPQIIVGYFASGVAAGWPAPAKRAGLFTLVCIDARRDGISAD